MKTFIKITETRTIEVPNEFELEPEILDAIKRKDLDALTEFFTDISDLEPCADEIVAVECIRRGQLAVSTNISARIDRLRH